MSLSSISRAGRGASRWLLFAAPAVCLLSACCGPDLDETIKAHKPAIEAKIATIPGIRDQVLQLPPLDADRVTHSGPAIVLDLAKPDSDGANTSLCYAEDLQNQEELGFVWGRIKNSAVLNECASIVRRGHEAFNPANPKGLLSRPFGFTAEMTFKRCEAVTSLLVVRTIEFVQPGAAEPAGSAFVPDLSICQPAASSVPSETDGGVAEAGAAKELRLRFGGGKVRAEVLVFALDGARFEGGFRVEASSSARIKGTDVQSDLADKLRAAIAAGVKQHVSGATVRL
jgi:hypothetical protein